MGVRGKGRGWVRGRELGASEWMADMGGWEREKGMWWRRDREVNLGMNEVCFRTGGTASGLGK